MTRTPCPTVRWLFVVALTLTSAGSGCVLWGGSAAGLMPCCHTLTDASPQNTIEPCCGAADQRQALPLDPNAPVSAPPESRMATFVHDVWFPPVSSWRVDTSPGRRGTPPDTHLLLSVFLI